MWAAWGELWAFADPVSFDGPAKTIRVNPEISSISTIEIYSAWVRWISLYDHLKFLPAIRTVGLDTLPGGQFTGLFIFLMNGWQIVTDHPITVDGIVYHDDGIPVFVIEAGGGVTNKVAALAYGVNTAGGTGVTASELWSYPTRTVTNEIPSVVEIRQEMDINSIKLTQIQAILDSISIPTASETATAVWNKPITDVSDKTTIGGFVTKVLLTIPKFLGLK